MADGSSTATLAASGVKVMRSNEKMVVRICSQEKRRNWKWRFLLSCGFALLFISLQLSLTMVGKRAAHRNVKISKQPFFSNLRESHDITTTNNCNWCDSRQVCHICSMTNEQENDAVTVSSSVETKNIHKKGDSTTTRHYQMIETSVRSNYDVVGTAEREKNPTSSFLFSLKTVYAI